MIKRMIIGSEDNAKGEIEEVDEYAELKGNYDNDEWQYLSLAERAAAAVDYQRIKVLLKEGLEKGEIQKAFAAAAYNHRMEVAWLLVEAGAKFYYYDREYDDEVINYCPVCLTKISTNDGTVCDHFVCLFMEGGYYWCKAPYFDDEVYELGLRLRKRDLTEENFERITEKAPENLRILFKQARKHHDLYWTVKGGVLAVVYDTPSRCSSICCNYFHPDPGAEEVRTPDYSDFYEFAGIGEDAWQGDKEAEGKKVYEWIC